MIKMAMVAATNAGVCTSRVLALAFSTEMTKPAMASTANAAPITGRKLKAAAKSATIDQVVTVGQVYERCV